MRDPYTDHVLRIAGIEPGDARGASGAMSPGMQQTAELAADPSAWRWGNPEQPRMVQQPPAYPPPALYGPAMPQRPPVCFDWTTVAFAAALTGLFGYLIGARRG